MRQAQDPKEFGKMVRKRLIEIDMTQNELAELLGICPPNLSRMLSGLRSGRKYRARIINILRLDSDAA